ncbi:MAG: prephenate dehydrogenase/arogenate dehydrogenase family protein [Firmicutes bacterium HGW-Firmicutes-1]|jgi:prephenate dehydrogenase|nr:MAG: prephenate dehydrogenase/arogenate dehydrogenase family protein [Firmicutes bacterium HGW-Firmicutes-1]
MIDQVGFIGLGLIGGSIAKAIKKNNLAKQIIAFDIDKLSLTLANQDNIVDVCAEGIDEHFKECSIIFLCCPVNVNIEAYNKLVQIVHPDCIITDVGSTKENIIEEINKHKSPCTFIGGHPMAGSDKYGYAAATAHLFENAYYILTPIDDTDKLKTRILYDLIKGIKALPVVISPDQHDLVTATISHVPHVIAALLVNMVKTLDSDEGYLHTLAAGGFKDITRIASSSPVMWQQICLTNKDNIVKILKHFKEDIDTIMKSIQSGNQHDIYDFFEGAREYRESFQEKTSGALLQSYSVTVDVVDEPGIIAQIATLLSNHEISIKNIGIINNREHTSGVLEIVFYDETCLEKSIEVLNDMNYVVYKR